MRAAPRRGLRLGRTAALRTGVAVATAAAAWAGAVAVTGPGAADPAPDGPGGLTLVAVDEVTFPLSLDPAPGRDDAQLHRVGRDPEAVAGWPSADGTGFAI